MCDICNNPMLSSLFDKLGVELRQRVTALVSDPKRRTDTQFADELMKIVMDIQARGEMIMAIEHTKREMLN